MESSQIKILAIDDKQENLIILKALLKIAFPDAITLIALNGFEGIEIARKEDPDVVLLDILMPEMDGFEVCRKFKEDAILCDIPIVFITAYKGERESRLAALDCGADAFLGKPIDAAELTAQIRAMSKIKAANNINKNEKKYLNQLIEEKNNILRENEQNYHSIFNFAPIGLCIISLDLKYLMVNQAYCKILGYSKKEFEQMSVFDVTCKDDIEITRIFYDNIIKEENTNIPLEKRYSRKDKKIIVGALTAALIKNDNNQPIYIVISMQDITQKKEAEEELVYIGYHDFLTGIYNRRFYEEEVRRIDTKRNLPISIVMGDLNGLKLINDSLGHEIGDRLLKRVAEIIKDECRADDIVARIGGDEFVVIFPQTDAVEAAEIVNRIKYKAAKEKIANLDISISFGHDTKMNEKQTISRTFSNAENDMYRHKLYEKASMKSKIVDIIKNTLFEKSSREALHSERVSKIASDIAICMGFEKEDINRIRVAGLIHDIGKIGIDEKILNKPGKLNSDEFKEIRKHPETGWRILKSTDEFLEVSDYVLNHHERWDGSGYPNGLKGEEISLEARIISVADAYDAMTRQRSYSNALSKEEAIEEMKKCAGKQFDPTIVDIFINNILLLKEKY